MMIKAFKQLFYVTQLFNELKSILVVIRNHFTLKYKFLFKYFV